MSEFDIPPLCVGTERDIDHDGHCRLCRLHPQTRVQDDELRATDEALVFRWLRLHKLHLMRALPSLVQYSSHVYASTSVKTVFVSWYETIYEMVHNTMVVGLPADALLEDDLYKDMITTANLLPQLDSCRSEQEVVCWLLASSGVQSTQSSQESEDKKEDGEEDEGDGVTLNNEDAPSFGSYSVVTTLNLPTVSRLLAEIERQHQARENTNKNQQDVDACCVCLDWINAGETSTIMSCGHLLHKQCEAPSMQAALNVPQRQSAVAFTCPICEVRVELDRRGPPSVGEQGEDVTLMQEEKVETM
jgi:hypothetical protein